METDETNKTESKEEPAEKPVKQEKDLVSNSTLIYVYSLTVTLKNVF